MGMTVRELLEEKYRRGASKDFWAFCNYMIPEMYGDGDREIMFKGFCDAITHYFMDRENPIGKDGKHQVLEEAISMAIFPRAGKSVTNALLLAWLAGNFPEYKMLLVSSSSDLAAELLQNVRGFMESAKYKAIFIDIVIARSNATEIGVKKISSEVKRPVTIRCVGIQGQITGKGANVIVVDDLYKSHTEAMNEKHNNMIKNLYDSVVDSRMEGMKRLHVHVGTRWTTNEKFADLEKENFYNIKIKIQAFNEQTMESNFPRIIPTKKLLSYRRRNELIFKSMYQQQAIDHFVRLFKPQEFDWVQRYPSGIRFAVVDTADKGTDYFAAGFFNITYTKTGKIIVLEDVIFDERPTEYTEKALVNKCRIRKPHIVYIESNKDRSFIRNIRKELGDETFVKEYVSSTNKHGKIFANAHRIMKYIKFNKLIAQNEKARQVYSMFINNVFDFVFGNCEHDDAPEVLAMAIIFSETDKQSLEWAKRDWYKKMAKKGVRNG